MKMNHGNIEVSPSELWMRPKIWAIILNLAGKAASGMATAMDQISTTDENDEYMIRVSDDGRHIIVIRDANKHIKDALMRKREWIEDEISRLSVGESPIIVDPASRHYERLKKGSAEAIEKISELEKQLAKIKKDIIRSTGLEIRYLNALELIDGIVSVNVRSIEYGVCVDVEGRRGVRGGNESKRSSSGGWRVPPPTFGEDWEEDLHDVPVHVEPGAQPKKRRRQGPGEENVLGAESEQSGWDVGPTNGGEGPGFDEGHEAVDDNDGDLVEAK